MLFICHSQYFCNLDYDELKAVIHKQCDNMKNGLLDGEPNLSSCDDTMTGPQYLYSFFYVFLITRQPLSFLMQICPVVGI